MHGHGHTKTPDNKLSNWIDRGHVIHTHSIGHKDLYQRWNFWHSGSSSPLALEHAWNSRYRAQQCFVWFVVGKRLSRGAVRIVIAVSGMANSWKARRQSRNAFLLCLTNTLMNEQCTTCEGELTKVKCLL